MQKSKRYLSEMAEMYGLPNELYIMKRGVKQKGDLRYDITEIPAIVINGQFNKTHGHIHSSGHDEEYIVLEGEAIFIFFDKDKFWSINAKKGNKVHIPGDAYHTTINPSKNKTLRLANWIHKDCVSDYKLIKQKKGMPFYYTTKGWVKNPNYEINF